jgi:hypothetical protein
VQTKVSWRIPTVGFHREELCSARPASGQEQTILSGAVADPFEAVDETRIAARTRMALRVTSVGSYER